VGGGASTRDPNFGERSGVVFILLLELNGSGPHEWRAGRTNTLLEDVPVSASCDAVLLICWVGRILRYSGRRGYGPTTFATSRTSISLIRGKCQVPRGETDVRGFHNRCNGETLRVQGDVDLRPPALGGRSLATGRRPLAEEHPEVCKVPLVPRSLRI
jgi:hypothetical protein